MKQLIIFSVFVFIIRVANAQPTAPVNQAWVPIAEFSDEFNGAEYVRLWQLEIITLEFIWINLLYVWLSTVFICILR